MFLELIQSCLKIKSLPRLQSDKSLGWKNAHKIKSELHCRRFAFLYNSGIAFREKIKYTFRLLEKNDFYFKIIA